MTLPAITCSYVIALVTLSGCGGRTSILDDDLPFRSGEEGGGPSVPLGTAGKVGSAGTGVVDPGLPTIPLMTPSSALGVAACPSKGNGVTGAGCKQLFVCSNATFEIDCDSRAPDSANITCTCMNPGGLSLSASFGASPTLCFDAGWLCIQ